MAYKLIPNPLLDDIPAHIINFAVNDVEWTQVSANRITTDRSDVGISFELAVTYNTGAYGQQLEARLIDGDTVLNRASVTVPYISQTFLTPSKLHIFSSLEPDPFLSVVVEFGNGFFRHLYLGYLQKFGDYGGGEVVSGSRHRVAGSAVNYRDTLNAYLFDGFHNTQSDATSGAVRLQHADLGGTVIAPFRAHTSRGASQNLFTNAVIGGFGNNVNDQQVARGQNTLAGVQVFTPINLYLTRTANRMIPIGVPPGVRLVNMQNIGADTAIVVGGKTWRCFPQFRRGGTSVPASGGGATMLLDETSYVVGYAHLEG